MHFSSYMPTLILHRNSKKLNLNRDSQTINITNILHHIIMQTKSLNLLATAAIALASWSCSQPNGEINYAHEIANNTLMDSVDAMARQIIRQGFNAGDGYGEVWIRDYNTFIELSMEELPDSAVRHNLNVFWHFPRRSWCAVQSQRSAAQLGGAEQMIMPCLIS